jgi:hypothetical protein
MALILQVLTPALIKLAHNSAGPGVQHVVKMVECSCTCGDLGMGVFLILPPSG